MIEALPLPEHRSEHESMDLRKCTRSSKHSLFQQPAKVLNSLLNSQIAIRVGRIDANGTYLRQSRRRVWMPNFGHPFFPFARI
jgi:hypothetical protein